MATFKPYLFGVLAVIFVLLFFYCNDTAHAANTVTIIKRAIHAYNKVDHYKSKYLIIIDFTKPSTQKRFYIYNTCSRKIIYSTYVAHGTGSGMGAYATSFSNQNGSHASSIGVAITVGTYQGKHGRSMQVQGLDRGYNTNMYSRAMVIHGCSYIGNGRTGHSWGCFAIPDSQIQTVINIVGSNTVIYAYYPNQSWLNNSYYNN
jgi:hypothetical protein